MYTEANNFVFILFDRLIDSLTTPSTETAIVHSVTGSVPESEDVDEEFDESVDYDAMFVGEHAEIMDEEEVADEG